MSAASPQSGNVRNVARFLADSFLSLDALRNEFKSRTPSVSDVERRYREFRRVWQRVVGGGRVSGRSSKQRTLSDLHTPILALLGFDRTLQPVGLDLDPGRVTLLTSGEDARPQLLIDPLPFALSADDRPDGSEYRGTVQRRMERALEASAAQFGLILGGTRWRIVQLAPASEPRYLEFDLDGIVEDDDTAAFALLLALISPESLEGEAPLLETLVARSDALGTEVSDKLGPAARRALETMLDAIRADERNAGWAPNAFVEGEPLQEVHREGIYLLYRLLFVLFAEAHGALPVDRPLYREAYSLERLRLSLSRSDEEFAPNAYGLWESVKALFRLIDRGAHTKEFNVPAYNGGLFASARTPRLDASFLNDRDFARAMRELTTVEIKHGKVRTRDRVSFRELGVGQLGAVFEGLLDYEPHVASEDLTEVEVGTGKQKVVSFLPTAALGDTLAVTIEEGRGEPRVFRGQFYLRAWGGQRKSTGSYYTPKVIADFLVREALAPQVEGKTSAEILETAVCDPAMGSGGFLVSATEFLGGAYYAALVVEGICDPEADGADLDRINAKRAVAERCIYGVDMNPMAVELAKVSLWLSTLSYDRPLSFFDHHLRCGNSLLGAPLRSEDGSLTAAEIQTIPKTALQSVDQEATREEKAALRSVAKRNDAQLRAAERGGMSMFALDLAGPLGEYAQARRLLSADDPTQSSEDAVERIRAKERQLRDLTQDPQSRFFRLKEICDLWMSPWFWPHDATCDPPTTDQYQALMRDVAESGSAATEPSKTILAQSSAIAGERRFFHWELEFPEVFERGGFDAVVGNPPWETLSPKTKEFFSNHDPQFRSYAKQLAVAKMRSLRSDPVINSAYRAFARLAYQLAAFIKNSGIYRWYATGNLAKGDFDLFRTFVERDFRSLRVGGHLGQVLKDSIYVNSNCSEIRQRLLSDGALLNFIVNENRKLVFPIHASIKVVLLVARRGEIADSVPMAFFVGKDVSGEERARSLQELVPVLADPERHTIPIPIEFIERLAPQTFSFLEICDRKDADLLDHLSRHGIPFGQAWQPEYCAELHASGDSDLFRYADWLEANGCHRDGWNWVHPELGEFWPLVEGRNIYQFEFPVGEFDKWVNSRDGMARVPRAPDGQPVNMRPRLAWRDVASSTNERSIIAAIVPPRTFCKHKAPTVRGGAVKESILSQIEALYNSFALDWQARVRGATGLTYTLLSQLFVPASLAALAILRPSRVDQEAAVLAAYGLPFELAEHVFVQFPLLDRLMPPLPYESRSTMTRDLVLARYAEMLEHPRAGFYRDRAVAAHALGAIPFVPETRGHDERAAEHDEEQDEDAAETGVLDFTESAEPTSGASHDRRIKSRE